MYKYNYGKFKYSTCKFILKMLNRTGTVSYCNNNIENKGSVRHHFLNESFLLDRITGSGYPNSHPGVNTIEIFSLMTLSFLKILIGSLDQTIPAPAALSQSIFSGRFSVKRFFIDTLCTYTCNIALMMMHI